MSSVECATCGSTVPARSRFCPECGRSLVPAESEAAAVAAALPREWGIVAVVLLAAAGIVLLAAGAWVWGALVLAAAVALAVGLRELQRRAGRAARRTVRSRLAAHRELLSARSRGQIELFRLRRELAELQAARSRGFLELGQAGYVRDRPAVQAARTRLDELHRLLAEKEAEVDALLSGLQERVGRARGQAAQTEPLPPAAERPRLPEPYPPPDEGSPPSPPTIPEPGPEPVPEPAPDPGPAEPPAPPERPPAPETRRRRATRARRG